MLPLQASDLHNISVIRESQQFGPRNLRTAVGRRVVARILHQEIRTRICRSSILTWPLASLTLCGTSTNSDHVATGTAEVGGWSTRELLSILDGLEGVCIVGADVVEVAPIYDNPGETTVLAAAEVAHSLMTLMVQTPVK